MGRKRTGAVPIGPYKEKKKLMLDINKANLQKEYMVPGFRSGRYMTEKDRPRKKNWKREYGKKPHGFYDDYINEGSFFSPLNLSM